MVTSEKNTFEDYKLQKADQNREVKAPNKTNNNTAINKALAWCIALYHRRQFVPR